MLLFMVRGLFSKLQFAYVQFPALDLSGDLLYEPFWEAVGRIEKCGLKVIVWFHNKPITTIMNVFFTRCLVQAWMEFHQSLHDQTPQGRERDYLQSEKPVCTWQQRFAVFLRSTTSDENSEKLLVVTTPLSLGMIVKASTTLHCMLIDQWEVHFVESPH